MKKQCENAETKGLSDLTQETRMLTEKQIVKTNSKGFSWEQGLL